MGSEIEARGSLKRGFHSFRLWWLMSLGIDSLIYVPPRYRHVKARTYRNEDMVPKGINFSPIPQARSRRRRSSKRRTGERKMNHSCMNSIPRLLEVPINASSPCL